MPFILSFFLFLARISIVSSSVVSSAFFSHRLHDRLNIGPAFLPSASRTLLWVICHRFFFFCFELDDVFVAVKSFFPLLSTTSFVVREIPPPFMAFFTLSVAFSHSNYARVQIQTYFPLSHPGNLDLDFPLREGIPLLRPSILLHRRPNAYRTTLTTPPPLFSTFITSFSTPPDR